MSQKPFFMDLVAGDASARLRIRCRDDDGDRRPPLDLTGQTVELRWSVDGGPTEERTMTVIEPQSDPVNTGRADYIFTAADLPAGGLMSYEVRVTDNDGRPITSLNSSVLRIRDPLADPLP